MRGRATGVVLPALVVVGLVAVVAIAATGSTRERSTSSNPPSETLLDILFTIGVIAFVAGTMIFAYGLTQRKAIAHEIASGRYRRGSLVTWLAFVGLFTAFTYWRISNWERPPAEESAVSDVIIGNDVVPSQPPPQTSAYEPELSWLPIALVVALLLAGGIAYVLSARRARRDRAGDTLAEELVAAVESALDDLRAEADPRRAIVAAYARLERVLAANGVARRPAETPDEYLARVLRDLELSPDAIGRLTALFAEAKFSHHHVDTAMKEEAIDALERVRDELRLSAERRDQRVPAQPAVVEA